MKIVQKNTDHQISEKMRWFISFLRDVLILQIRTDPIADILSEILVKDRIVIHMVDTFLEGGTGCW